MLPIHCVLCCLLTLHLFSTLCFTQSLKMIRIIKLNESLDTLVSVDADKNHRAKSDIRLS